MPLPLWVEDERFEWNDGLMYFAIVDRFKDGDAGAANPVCSSVDNVATIANVQGGDLLGLTETLESGISMN